MELSLRLRDLRKNLKIRQADVAEHLGISISTYTKYETGNNQPDLNMLIKLSKYYDVSADFLLGISNSKSTVEKISLDKQELLDLYNQLSIDDKYKVIEIVRAFSKVPGIEETRKGSA